MYDLHCTKWYCTYKVLCYIENLAMSDVQRVHESRPQSSVLSFTLYLLKCHAVAAMEKRAIRTWVRAVDVCDKCAIEEAVLIHT